MIALRSLLEKMNVDYEIIGDCLTLSTMKFSSIDNASPGSITFCDKIFIDSTLSRLPLEIIDSFYNKKIDMKKIISKVVQTEASVIICPNFSFLRSIKEKTIILVENPRLAFINLVDHFYRDLASIDPSTFIGDNVTIGNNVSIGPNCTIGKGGFGYRRNKEGKLTCFPQIGGIIIEDDVSIHSNVCIDRGALGDTIIGKGTKIDNLVHIAHNVKIGKNCVIVANAMIGGSVEIGDNSWIAPSASILNGIRIGKNCVVGMGSVVLYNVQDNTTVKGIPAR